MKRYFVGLTIILTAFTVLIGLPYLYAIRIGHEGIGFFWLVIYFPGMVCLMAVTLLTFSLFYFRDNKVIVQSKREWIMPVFTICISLLLLMSFGGSFIPLLSKKNQKRSPMVKADIPDTTALVEEKENVVYSDTIPAKWAPFTEVINEYKIKIPENSDVLKFQVPMMDKGGWINFEIGVNACTDCVPRPDGAESIVQGEVLINSRKFCHSSFRRSEGMRRVSVWEHYETKNNEDCYLILGESPHGVEITDSSALKNVLNKFSLDRTGK